MTEDNHNYTILVVDDDEGLSTLIQKRLQREGFQTATALSGNEAIEWINQQSADLMLLDFLLPDMNGDKVIETLGERQKQPPFILVTGQGDERLAVEMMKKGALDYLVKDQGMLELLPSVVRHTIEQLEQQRQLVLAEKALKESIVQYQGIFNSATDAFFVVEFEGRIVEANPKAASMYGYSQIELVGMGFPSLFVEAEQNVFTQLHAEVQTHKDFHAETVHAQKDGTSLDVEITGTVFDYKGQEHILIITRDISERKWAEEELQLTNQQLRVSEQAVKEREARLRAIFQGSAIGIALVDLGGRALESNLALEKILGYSRVELREMVFTDYTHPENQDQSRRIFEDLVQGKCEHYQIEKRYVRKDKSEVWVRVTASLVRGEGNRPNYIINIVEDISERKEAEQSLLQSEAKYRLLFEHMMNGFAYHQVVLDEQLQPVDYIFLEVNDAFEQITGLKKADIIGKRVSEVLPEVRDSSFDWIITYAKVALAGQSVKFDQYSEALQRWFSISAYSPQQGYFVTIFEDITQRRQIEEELRNFSAELENSNRELENFAHVVSQELHKPLQTAAGSAEHLGQTGRKKLDDASRELLDRIMDSTKTMQTLTSDLMRYAKLITDGAPFEPVNLKDLIQEVLAEQENSLKGIGARVEVGSLPDVLGDRFQLKQLWENLLTNAVKFRSEQPLVIKIHHKAGPERYEIKVADNGLGVEPRHHKRIFGMFQRLHPPEKYPGTGIGLTISKKIVERHGGKIWIESHPGRGSEVHFTLPKSETH